MIAANTTPEPEETPEPAGGKGELLSDQIYQKADLRTISMALNRQWKVPQEALDTLPAKVFEIAADPEAAPDLVLKATAVLDKMQQTNSRQIALAAGIDQRNPGGVTNIQINNFADAPPDEQRKRLARVLAENGYAATDSQSNGHSGRNGAGPNGHAGEILPP